MNNELYNKIVRITKKKYGKQYCDYFTYADLESDIGYLYTLHIHNKKLQYPESFFLTIFHRFFMDKLRSQGPYYRDGKVRSVFYSMDVMKHEIDEYTAESIQNKAFLSLQLRKLTRVEKEVYDYMIQGFSNTEIATIRGVSVDGVNQVVRRIKKRLSGGTYIPRKMGRYVNA